MAKKLEAKSAIVAAITAVMGSIGKLGKENKNTFDNYKFTSIDDFMAATGKACSENGLVVVQSEVSRETIEKASKSGSSAWLLIEFSFLVMHESGECLDLVHRSVAVPFTGAQAFGSAQSYALKQFMRSLFQIATGDKDDADFGPQGDAPTTIKTKKAEKPEPLIKLPTHDTLVGIADKLQAFPNRGVFLAWVKLASTRKVDIRKLTEHEGNGLIKALTERPDVSQWPGPWVTALTTAMKQVREANDDVPG